MSIGCCIYFTPADRSWVASSDFIRDLAEWFGAKTFEHVRAYRFDASSSVPGPDDDDAVQCLLDVHHLSIEAAAALQCPGPDSEVVLQFGSLDALNLMGESVIRSLPEQLSEGWCPVDAAIHRGHWKVYDQGGDFVDAGSCCLALSSDLGYPVDTKEYLAAYLAVPEVARMQRILEELSAQLLTALIELT